MRYKILSRQTLFIAVLMGLALSSALLFYITHAREVQNGSALPAETISALVKKEYAGPGLPVRLNIPKINVNAAIEHVGLTPNGAMDAPKDPGNAAWFERGPRPGEQGSSVIDGHFGWKNGRPAVFDDLRKLERGDKLYVEDEQGKVTAFLVRELRTYGKNENASSVFGSSDGKAHLNLITCKGVWNKVQKSYSDRLVVFADKEADE